MCPRAAEVLALLEQGTYRDARGETISLAALQAAAVAGTRLIDRSPIAAPLADATPEIYVTGETTQQALARLIAGGASHVGLLNFASARRVGGGFLNGARAQEEDLCRCSGLYPCLASEAAAPYYQRNGHHPNALYTDLMIYSPAVPFFRLSGNGPLLPQPLTAGVLTAPAPNTGAFGGDADLLHAAFEQRIGLVLQALLDAGHRTIILGAWGCGAFRGDPVRIAGCFARWLADPRYRGAFEHILFAVLARGRLGQANLAAFRSQLA